MMNLKVILSGGKSVYLKDVIRFVVFIENKTIAYQLKDKDILETIDDVRVVETYKDETGKEGTNVSSTDNT